MDDVERGRGEDPGVVERIGEDQFCGPALGSSDFGNETAVRLSGSDGVAVVSGEEEEAIEKD